MPHLAGDATHVDLNVKNDDMLAARVWHKVDNLKVDFVTWVILHSGNIYHPKNMDVSNHKTIELNSPNDWRLLLTVKGDQHI